ncbi:MAG: hypothetical protein V1887_03780 [Candidatus Aenigmatarchaeota archaeon]
MQDIWLEKSLQAVPHLLTLLDREPSSPSYGCFDRQWWKYKVTDFVDARFQEAALSLALLTKSDCEWKGDKQIAELAKAACRFWAKIQAKDGSFDEYHPHEHSHVATAFSAWSIAAAVDELNMKDEVVINALAKAGDWLAKHTDTVVANHDAGAAAALMRIYKVTGDEKYLLYAKKKMELVLSLQDTEGWFNEYGGADIGYQSFSIYYLADYWLNSHDCKVKAALEKAIEFFSYFVHPDGSAGGGYGSRGTNLILPAGFEMLAAEIPKAAQIAAVLRDAIKDGGSIDPVAFDDRFVTGTLYSYLIAARYGDRQLQAGMLPSQGKPFSRHFQNCGLYVRKTPKFYVVVNIKNGGAATVFKGKELAYSDAGLVGILNGRTVTSAGFSTAIVSDSKVEINGSWRPVKSRYQKPSTQVAVRIATSIGLSGTVKKAARRALVAGSKRSGDVYSRLIGVSDRVIIGDMVGKAREVTALSSPVSFSTSTGLWKCYRNQSKVPRKEGSTVVIE